MTRSSILPKAVLATAAGLVLAGCAAQAQPDQLTALRAEVQAARQAADNAQALAQRNNQQIEQLADAVQVNRQLAQAAQEQSEEAAQMSQRMFQDTLQK